MPWELEKTAAALQLASPTLHGAQAAALVERIGGSLPRQQQYSMLEREVTVDCPRDALL